VVLGLYQFTTFKTKEKDKKQHLNEFTVIDESEKNVNVIRSASKNAEIIAKAVYFARDMVSAPGNAPALHPAG
jgi:leucyl aminopeptidase